MKLNSRAQNRTAGDGLVFVIIFLALIGIGIWWLYSHKKEMDKAARIFGREAIEALTVRYDEAFYANNLSPQAKVDNPPSVQKALIEQLRELGTPAQPIKIDENVTWQNQFFEPSGYFTAHLNYPARTATMQIAISHPVSKWQIDNVTFSVQRGIQ